MTDDQIKYMVSRFLGWRLPENFNPDGGISFKRTFNDHMPFGPMKHAPRGTNLFDYTQAEAMVRHMIDGLPLSAPQIPEEEAARAPGSLRDRLARLERQERFLAARVSVEDEQGPEGQMGGE